MAARQRAQQPPVGGFRPIVVQPAAAPVDFTPVQVAPVPVPPATPVAPTQEPNTGKED